MKSKTIFEENRFNELYFKIQSTYKNSIQKKLDEINHKLEEDDEMKDCIDDDFDKKIASRIRSRGIGFSKIFSFIINFLLINSTFDNLRNQLKY